MRSFRASADLIARVDAWAKANGVARSEAIRRLVELGLGRG
jgi:metal-responsive CopG/Arc/MetJ family transcriptional regulator